jgi:hypothetical protein
MASSGALGTALLNIIWRLRCESWHAMLAMLCCAMLCSAVQCSYHSAPSTTCSLDYLAPSHPLSYSLQSATTSLTSYLFTLSMCQSLLASSWPLGLHLASLHFTARVQCFNHCWPPVSWPLTLLHLLRYRLLIRRAMEGDRRLGMAQMRPSDRSHLDPVATEAEILECTAQPDG